MDASALTDEGPNESGMVASATVAETERRRKLEEVRSRLDALMAQQATRHAETFEDGLQGCANPHVVASSSLFLEGEGGGGESSRGRTSFETSRHSASILWETADGASGRTEVPRTVARAFGAKQRAFSDSSRFEAFLESLISETCWQRAVDALSRRDFSGSELSRRLQEEGFPLSDVESAVMRAKSNGMIDSARYAESFIREKTRFGWGRGRIERELMARGVDPNELSGYPGEFFSHEEELERAESALRKKRVPEKNPVPKLMRFLVGRGFSTEIARRAVRDFLDDGESTEG
jgi:regulatory protein